MEDCIVVDFLKLNPKHFELLSKKKNGFGGYSVGIRYCGMKLYVKYGKRQCVKGVVRWGNGKSSNYSIAVSLKEDDLYFDKANELDSFFMEKFGSVWGPLVKGSVYYTMDFKVLCGYSETEFFGEVRSGSVDSKIPRKANVKVLALWDNVSIGNTYGAVVRPKAVQIFVSDVPKVEIYSDGDDRCVEFTGVGIDSGDDDHLFDCMC